MTKLQVLSDLHVEFYKDNKQIQIEDTDADLILLVGDIHTNARGVRWLLEQGINKPILYVAGNHEAYSTSLPKNTIKLKEAAKDTNIHILENDYYIHNDLVILGCTLWTDYKLFDPIVPQSLAMNHCYTGMNDFSRIRNSDKDYRKIRPNDLLAKNIESLDFLTTYLEVFKDWKVGVATHHSPSIKGVNPIHHKDILSSSYASNLDEFVGYSGAKFWAFGHTHYKVDTYIGDTRFISNPKGYIAPFLSVDGFDPKYVIEV